MFIEAKDLNQDYIVIDIRSMENIETTGHIPNALFIFKDELLKSPAAYLNKDQKYVLYCNGGNSASLITKALSIQGYQVYCLKGGYRGYQESK